MLDTCKCVGNLLNNPGKAENYQGWELVKNPAPYKIAVPTLSGTGSETSRTGIICNEEKNIKLGMNSDYTMFEQVLLDPDLTASVPRNQYFYTGIDTYMHCFESITGSYRNVVVDSLAEKAIDLSKQVYLSSDMMSDENREKLMIASFLGGMAAGFVGVVHPLSAGLSMVLHMHHGIANCHALTVLEDIYPNEYKDIYGHDGTPGHRPAQGHLPGPYRCAVRCPLRCQHCARKAAFQPPWPGFQKDPHQGKRYRALQAHVAARGATSATACSDNRILCAVGPSGGAFATRSPHGP